MKKKYLIILTVTLPLLIGLYFTYKLLDKDTSDEGSPYSKEEKNFIETEDYSNFMEANSVMSDLINFQSPKNSEINNENDAYDGYKIEDTKIEYGSNEFEISIHYQKNPKNAAISRTQNFYAFSDSDFEIISKDSQNLIISKKGATIYFDNGSLVGGKPSTDEEYYIFELYSDGVSEYQSLFQDQDFYITYSFLSQGSLEKWPLYKKILKEIILSIEKK